MFAEGNKGPAWRYRYWLVAAALAFELFARVATPAAALRSLRGL